MQLYVFSYTLRAVLEDNRNARFDRAPLTSRFVLAPYANTCSLRVGWVAGIQRWQSDQLIIELAELSSDLSLLPVRFREHENLLAGHLADQTLYIGLFEFVEFRQVVHDIDHSSVFAEPDFIAPVMGWVS